MKIKLTRNVKRVDGSWLEAGAEFDVLDSEPVGPSIDDKPFFCSIAIGDTKEQVYSLEFEVID